MIGSTIGPYHVLAKLGEGGMGEVYRARDTKLKRDVALKVLPADVATDRERLARFQREAEVLASLSHPNIATIYGIEDSALVMELVEGEDLSQRIARAAIPVDDALAIAKQIADALEAAHEAGIVHRDLKPANVKVRPDGTVKVLDFGLAKALQDPKTLGPQDLENSPTITSPAMTQRGVILGTAAYMSPEQAKGKPVDKRTDIWAFGCVLYEMLTGRRAFSGEDVTDTLVEVLKSNVDMTRLPAGTPASVRRVIERCLQRDVKNRLRDIGDARFELDAPAVSETGGRATTAPKSWRSIGLAAGVIVAVAGFAGGYFTRPAGGPASGVSRFAIDLPADLSISRGTTSGLALSPDDSALAFVAGTGGTRRLYVKWRNEAEPKEIPGTVSASDPVFSPDGRWIAFHSGRGLQKVSLADGTAVTIAPIPDGTGTAWTADGTIVFAPVGRTGLMRVSANGGTMQPLTKADPAAGETTHTWPDVLPDGDHVLYTIEYLGKSFDEAAIGVVSLSSGATKVILKGGAFARYSPSGHIVYAQADRLLAVPFDTSRLEIAGDATTVATGVSREIGRGRTHMAISRAGSLAYVPGDVDISPRELVWVDRSGSVTPASKIQVGVGDLSLTPDGTRVFVHVVGADDDLWTIDLVRDVSSRLTFGTENMSPVAAPDGRRFAWSSDRHGAFNLYLSSIENPQDVERLTTSDVDQMAGGFSPDGKFLLYSMDGPSTTDGDIWMIPLDGRREPRPLLKTPFFEGLPAVSPDGRWLAYGSNASGSQAVHVQPFLRSGPARQVTGERGAAVGFPRLGSSLHPLRWSRDGRELFYLNVDRVMSVLVSGTREFSAGAPRQVFQMPDMVAFDVAPDGRFLVARDMPLARLGRIVLAVGGASEIGRTP